MVKNKPIRVGIAGLGRAGWGMICPELKGREKMFTVAAVCDPIEDRLAMAKERYGCRTYRRIDGLVADRDIDLFVIATRSCDHCAHALLALKTGKDVLVEKPMCTTYAEALKMKRASDRAKGTLYVRHNRRFEPPFVHIREIIASGILGDVFEIKLRRNGFQRRDDWQTLKRFGGGQLLNWGPHIIDHALRFLDSPPAGMWSDLKLVAAVGDAEDHLKIVLQGKKGRYVDLEISGGAVIGEPEYLVMGSRGAVRCTGDDIYLRYLDPRQKLAVRRPHPETPGTTFGTTDELKWIEETIKAAPKARSGMSSIWDYLYDAIRKRKPFPVTLDQALAVMKVVSAAKKGTPFA